MSHQLVLFIKITNSDHCTILTIVGSAGLGFEVSFRI